MIIRLLSFGFKFMFMLSTYLVCDCTLILLIGLSAYFGRIFSIRVNYYYSTLIYISKMNELYRIKFGRLLCPILLKARFVPLNSY